MESELLFDDNVHPLSEFEIVLTWQCCIIKIINITMASSSKDKPMMAPPSLFVASFLYLLINIVGSKVDKYC